MFRRKDEIEAEGDLPQQCEFYDVRNLVHSVTSEPFVVQRKFRSQSAKQTFEISLFQQDEEKVKPTITLVLFYSRREGINISQYFS